MADPQTNPITCSWSWWSDFLQREYYSGETESGGWDAAAAAIARALGAEPGMRLLDLGCGAGDIVLRMAMRGLDAVGVEHSVPLVEHCARRAREVGVAATFVAADMFEFEPDGRFDLVLSLNTSFGYGSDAQNRCLIASAARWLRPGGMLYLDVVTADAAKSFGHWEDDVAGGRLIVDNEWDVDRQLMISSPQWITPDGSTVYRADGPEVVRIYRRDELEQMMTGAGFLPRRLGRAMARTFDQHDGQMLTTWVATKSESCEE